MANRVAIIEKLVLRRLTTTPPVLRCSLLLSAATKRAVHTSSSHRYSTSIPSVTQPSFWASLIPKPLRRKAHPPGGSKRSNSKEWNPATFFIIIFLLIGSMSIQMIALRNDFAAFSRRADAKIELLREVIERVQKGEEVDIEGLLGTGDPEKEKEWEEVLQEIEREDEIWVESGRKRLRRDAVIGDHTRPAADGAINRTTNNALEKEDLRSKKKSNAPPGFY